MPPPTDLNMSELMNVEMSDSSLWWLELAAKSKCCVFAVGMAADMYTHTHTHAYSATV